MPRTARVLLPNYPHHIVQRGHNRQVVFAQEHDFQYYLNNLRECKSAHVIKVYAYCLMTNHVHLILEPGEDAAAVGRLMKRLAGRQTRYFNRQENRRGTLWEGRYKSSPIQTDAYLLACCRYVELNPVRARMVAAPEQYRWSSYSERIDMPQGEWLDQHNCYIALGRTPRERQAHYSKFVSSSISDRELGLIRQSVQRGQLTGGETFIDAVERIIGRRIEHKAPGRQPTLTR